MSRTPVSVLYHVRAEAATIEARARALAVEQSVEMPLEAIDDPTVLADTVGRVEGIEDLGDGRFAVRIDLAAATMGAEAGQMLNMLFGNSSIHDDIALVDVAFPTELAAAFGGPRHGVEGLRRRMGARGRAFAASALKPQGLSVPALAQLAERLALGGLDLIKDDHGLADQSFSPFAERVRACAAAVRRANAATGGATRYAPSLTGDLDALRRQAAIARDEGLDVVLVAPMAIGLPAFHTLVRTNPDMAILAHPALAGAQRIAPPLLLGRLFRLLGADATVFPNHGGRFGYDPATCRALAGAALAPWPGIAPCLPVPAGGMTTGRVTEMLDFHGPDVMLLIGGALLSARDRLTDETLAFTRQVRRHVF
jgi:ribulose-bisphosphate carboxylase large chain